LSPCLFNLWRWAALHYMCPAICQAGQYMALQLLLVSGIDHCSLFPDNRESTSCNLFHFLKVFITNALTFSRTHTHTHTRIHTRTYTHTYITDYCHLKAGQCVHWVASCSAHQIHGLHSLHKCVTVHECRSMCALAQHQLGPARPLLINFMLSTLHKRATVHKCRSMCALAQHQQGPARFLLINFMFSTLHKRVTVHNAGQCVHWLDVC
jgi:hypothetical protein